MIYGLAQRGVEKRIDRLQELIMFQINPEFKQAIGRCQCKSVEMLKECHRQINR